MRLNNVVLPAPFGPMIRRRSPGITRIDDVACRRQSAEALVETFDRPAQRSFGWLRRVAVRRRLVRGSA